MSMARVHFWLALCLHAQFEAILVDFANRRGQPGFFFNFTSIEQFSND